MKAQKNKAEEANAIHISGRIWSFDDGYWFVGFDGMFRYGPFESIDGAVKAAHLWLWKGDYAYTGEGEEVAWREQNRLAYEDMTGVQIPPRKEWKCRVFLSTR